LRLWGKTAQHQALTHGGTELILTPLTRARLWHCNSRTQQKPATQALAPPHLKAMRCAMALPKGDGVPTSDSSAAVENPRNGSTPAGNAPLPKSSPSAQLVDAGISRRQLYTRSLGTVDKGT